MPVNQGNIIYISSQLKCKRVSLTYPTGSHADVQWRDRILTVIVTFIGTNTLQLSK